MFHLGKYKEAQDQRIYLSNSSSVPLPLIRPACATTSVVTLHGPGSKDICLYIDDFQNMAKQGARVCDECVSIAMARE
jgi:hypothetical protein